MTTSAPVEKVSQEEMLGQFKTRYQNLLKENQQKKEKGIR